MLLMKCKMMVDYATQREANASLNLGSAAKSILGSLHEKDRPGRGLALPIFDAARHRLVFYQCRY